jgi:hypothetical protein
MPDILTQDVQDDYLTNEALNSSDLTLLIERAEVKTINRYRETRPEGRFQIEGIDGEPLEEDVQLDGFVEPSGGGAGMMGIGPLYPHNSPESTGPKIIDLQASDERLVRALRATVARIVEFWVDKPDEAEHISRLDQGERRVDFRDKDLPSSVYAPLRRFDQRDVWF